MNLDIFGFILVGLISILAVGLLIKVLYETWWDSKATDMSIDIFKTYTKITIDDVTSAWMVGASIPRQIALAGHRCKIQKDAYSNYDGREYTLYAEPEVIAIVKLYIDNGGYCNMMLSDFLKKMYPADDKATWLPKL